MIADEPLSGCRILLVEDEYMIASEMALELEEAGAVVVGPCPTVERALILLDTSQPDGAILDHNLGGEQAFPVADALIDRGIPFILTTGYDASAIPTRFAHVARCEKPVNIRRITSALDHAIHGRLT